jgi:hypothetical protein
MGKTTKRRVTRRTSAAPVTPGPHQVVPVSELAIEWRVDANVREYSWGPAICPPGIREPIAIVVGVGSTERHQTGNGCLFAAAYQLLEQAKLFERCLAYEIRRKAAAGDDEGARLTHMTLLLLRDVIAQAEGRNTSGLPVPRMVTVEL